MEKWAYGIIDIYKTSKHSGSGYEHTPGPLLATVRTGADSRTVEVPDLLAFFDELGAEGWLIQESSHKAPDRDEETLYDEDILHKGHRVFPAQSYFMRQPTR